MCKLKLYSLSLSQIALVKWTESVGLTLVERDLVSMTTEGPGGERDQYEILQLFPFTSEKKRMGIIVRVRTAISELIHFSHFWYIILWYRARVMAAAGARDRVL